MTMNQLQIAKHQERRNLVSIRRDDIDPNGIQAFILDHSDHLVALQYVYDFHLDGLMFLRMEDITGVSRSGTDKFQQGLLAQEGLLQQVPFGATFALDGWQTLLPQLSREHGFMILECEAGKRPEFFIGTAVELTHSGVQGRYFTGGAHWESRPRHLKFKAITSCQVRSNYIEVYRRHFQRLAP